LPRCAAERLTTAGVAQLTRWLEHDARHRLAFSFGLAAIAAFVLHARVRPWTLAMLTWDVFALSVLALAWVTILTTPDDALRRRAQEQDLSRSLIFVFLVIAAVSSLFAVVYLLHSTKVSQSSHLLLHCLMTLFAVVGAWAVTHTVFGMRYAHTFYGDDEPHGQDHAGGLDFPGNCTPNYMDFAYFSFVIGMTFQVSDVQVTSREMRQLVLLHGIISFAFNTVILALAINTVSSLI
jgi:uncharacterized membrane protein